MNQENQETMNQNQNQTETKVRWFKSRLGNHYLEFVGEVGTSIYEDGRKVNSGWKLGEAERDSMWVEIGELPPLLATPSEPKPKPMTIREAAKALRELPSKYQSPTVSVSVEITNDKKVRCHAYHDHDHYQGSSFENVLAQIKAVIEAKNSAPETEADRIIDL